MSMTGGPFQNTDVTLWRNENAEVYLTADGKGLGICSGGRCVVKPVADWVALGWTAPMLLTKPTPPSPPQPKELCEVCGHPETDLVHGDKVRLADLPNHAFKPAQASKEACPHECVDGKIYNGEDEHGLEIHSDCTWEGHGKPAVCPECKGEVIPDGYNKGRFVHEEGCPMVDP